MQNYQLYRETKRTEKDGKHDGIKTEGYDVGIERNRKLGHKKRKIRDS